MKNNLVLTLIFVLAFFAVQSNGVGEAAFLPQGTSSVSTNTTVGVNSDTGTVLNIDAPAGSKINYITFSITSFYNYSPSCNILVRADGVDVYNIFGHGGITTGTGNYREPSIKNITVYFSPSSNVQIININTQNQGNGAEWCTISASYGYGADIADNSTVIEAKNAANSANTAAQSAKSSADNSAIRSWYTGVYGGSPESAANLAGYIRMPQHLKTTFST